MVRDRHHPAVLPEGLRGVTAEYSLRPDGDIQVVNTCIQGTLDGDVRRVRGKAWVVDKTSNAKLKVRFFWPFWGSYWIIGLDPDYQWAVVGHPGRKYLWILSRSPQMEDALYGQILELIAGQGYDLSRIEKTLQRSGEER